MEENKKKIEYLEEIKSDLNFQAIYELGRHMPLDGKELMQPLSEIGKKIESKVADADIILGNVENFFLELADNILNHQLGFPTIVIDFVLFDPADVTGKRFYIVVCSINSDIVEKYKFQVGENIKGDTNNDRTASTNENGVRRRPILTNPHIYKSPYFYKGSEERNLNEYKKFKRIDKENIEIHFGSFQKRAHNPLDINEQVVLIEEFFDLIQKELNSETKNGKDIFEFNTTILIPLMRPAASYVGDDTSRLSGGGIFIYGQLKDLDSNGMVKLVARLKYFFERKILETSHTQIAIEKQKQQQSFLELNLFHHFGSNMRELPKKLSFANFGADNLNEKQKRTLRTTSTYIKNYINNTVNLLSSYQKALANDSSNKENLYEYLNELKEKEKDYKEDDATINILYDEQLNRYKSGVPKDIFCNYCEQLVTNAVKEYNSQNIAPEKRQIEISLSKAETEGQDCLLVQISNAETNITDAVILMNAGLKPIKSFNSSGVGLYFLNFSLQLMGAIKMEDVEGRERYFKLTSSTIPKKLTISFSFPLSK